MEYKELETSGNQQGNSADEELVDDDLLKRFEVWHKGQLVLKVDLNEETFVVEWHTRKTVRGFASEAKELLSYDRKPRVSCMLSEEDGDKYITEKTLPVINARHSYPDTCTYMEADPEEDDIAIAWADGTPHPTITMRGDANSLDRLGDFVQHTIVDRDLSNEEIEEIVSESIDTIEEEINPPSNNGSSSSLVDKSS